MLILNRAYHSLFSPVDSPHGRIEVFVSEGVVPRRLFIGVGDIRRRPRFRTLQRTKVNILRQLHAQNFSTKVILQLVPSHSSDSKGQVSSSSQGKGKQNKNPSPLTHTRGYYRLIVQAPAS